MNFAEAKHFLDRDNALAIGEIVKTHGYKGQVNILFDFDPLEFEEESVLVDINGWLVPFFIEYDFCNLEALKPIVKFKGINTEKDAEVLVHGKVFLPREIAEKYIDTDSFEYLTGYVIEDITSGKKGVISGFDDIKNNPLIRVEIDGEEILIPELAVEVVDMDHDKRYLKIKAPEGLL